MKLSFKKTDTAKENTDFVRFSNSQYVFHCYEYTLCVVEKIRSGYVIVHIVSGEHDPNIIHHISTIGKFYDLVSPLVSNTEILEALFDTSDILILQ